MVLSSGLLDVFFGGYGVVLGILARLVIVVLLEMCVLFGVLVLVLGIQSVHGALSAACI